MLYYKWNCENLEDRSIRNIYFTLTSELSLLKKLEVILLSCYLISNTVKARTLKSSAVVISDGIPFLFSKAHKVSFTCSKNFYAILISFHPSLPSLLWEYQEDEQTLSLEKDNYRLYWSFQSRCLPYPSTGKRKLPNPAQVLRGRLMTYL